MIVTVDGGQLADLARAEAQRHPARTPERRAAAHLWACLITTTTIGGARHAVRGFGDDRTQSGALALLGRLAAELAGHGEDPAP